MEKVKNRWLIAASAVGIHISIGAVYAYSVLKKPLFDQVGWEYSHTAWAFSIAILCLGFTAALLGKYAEKLGPKKSGMIAAVLYGGGLLLSGWAVDIDNLWLFYLGYGVIGGMGLGVGYIAPVSTLIKWFPDRRGLATGLAIMGFGFGALIASSVYQFSIPELGISTTMYMLGAVYMVVMISSAQYLAPPPTGWLPKGMVTAENSNGKAVKKDLAELTVGEAMKTKRFYYLWFMFFINITCGIAIISVASPLSQEVAGLTTAAAIAMVGAMGLFNGVGRIAWSSFSDKIGRPMTFTAFFAIQIVAFMLLPQTTNAFFFQMLIFIIISCYGGGFATMPAFVGDIFGTKHLSMISGYVLTAWGVAGLIGPQMAAYIREATGSYEQTLYIFAGLFIVALVLSILMQRNIKQVRKQSELQDAEETASLKVA
ncbi:L-lactate MFS transporter [Algivirga pacifica]|uniref:OFA family MFS transporter n=1 Tax=Algivirga pacifica TaxID=1162670 RepID=A0ABP9D8W0_9BACT